MNRCSNRFLYDVLPGMDFTSSKSKTMQHFKDNADINKIVDNFTRTGVLGMSTSVPTRKPTFGDFSNIDFQRSAEIVATADSNFELLPAAIRNRFENNVQELLDFVSDPSNKDEAISLGIMDPDTNPKNAFVKEPPVTPDVPVEAPPTPNVVDPPPKP